MPSETSACGNLDKEDQLLQQVCEQMDVPFEMMRRLRISSAGMFLIMTWLARATALSRISLISTLTSARVSSRTASSCRSSAS